MNLTTVSFKITGISPLLTHNPASMEPGETKMQRKKIPPPEEEAEKGLYKNADGQICIPSGAFRSALLYAAGGKKVGKRSGRAVLAASVFTIDELVPLQDSRGKPLKAYEIDSRRVVLKGGDGIVRSRPKFPEWTCVLRLQIDLDLIPEKAVCENLDEGGKLAGVGDYRPERKGQFGRFNAELMN